MLKLSMVYKEFVVLVCLSTMVACAPGSLDGEPDQMPIQDLDFPSSDTRGADTSSDASGVDTSRDSRSDTNSVDTSRDTSSVDTSVDTSSVDTNVDTSSVDSSVDTSSVDTSVDTSSGSNECLLNPCDANATCTDLANGFSCTCNSGYIGDGTSCRSDGVSECKADPDCILKGPTPYWPVFHEPDNHTLDAGSTHVWSFVYEYQVTGRMGATLSVGSKNLKISEVAGDTQEAGVDCWRDFGDYVYYEPETGTSLGFCNLIVGRLYYLNIKNVDSSSTRYQLKGGT